MRKLFQSGEDSRTNLQYLNLVYPHCVISTKLSRTQEKMIICPVKLLILLQKLTYQTLYHPQERKRYTKRRHDIERVVTFSQSFPFLLLILSYEQETLIITKLQK